MKKRIAISLQRNYEEGVSSVKDFVSNAYPYVGYHGNNNLGDVELFNLSLKYLPFRSFALDVHRRGRYMPITLLNKKYYFVGGGTLIFSQDILEQCELLNKKGLRPIFLGTGAGLVPEKKEIKDRWKAVFQSSAGLFVRGRVSIDHLKQIGVDAQIIGDLAYLSNFDLDKPKEGKGYVVVNGRCIRPSNYPLFSLDFKIRDVVEEIIWKYLDEGIEVKLLGVSTDDYPTLRGWKKQFGDKIEYIEYNNNYQTFLDLISEASALVSMRMHPGVFAISWGVPAVELDNRHKYVDCYSPLEKEERAFSIMDPINTPVEEIYQQSLNYFNESYREREKRFDAVRKLAITQRQFCEKIFDFK